MLTLVPVGLVADRRFRGRRRRSIRWQRWSTHEARSRRILSNYFWFANNVTGPVRPKHLNKKLCRRRQDCAGAIVNTIKGSQAIERVGLTPYPWSMLLTNQTMPCTTDVDGHRRGVRLSQAWRWSAYRTRIAPSKTAAGYTNVPSDQRNLPLLLW